MSSDQKTVLVTGAGGKTGILALKKLIEQSSSFQARAFVHSTASANRVSQDSGLPHGKIHIGDVTQSSSELQQSMQGVHAVIIATSAVPKLRPTSLVGVLANKISFGAAGSRMPSFWYPQSPEQVDWVGQKNQIDAAKAAGVRHIVLVSSMGGTKPDHFLNKMGEGNILIWKRRAEQHLMQSGLDYTIIHPGGLIDTPGGERELVVGIDDTLMENKKKSIPRADVAELCIQALQLPEYRNRSFDVIANEPGGKTDFRALLANLKKDCDYSLGVTDPAQKPSSSSE